MVIKQAQIEQLLCLRAQLAAARQEVERLERLEHDASKAALGLLRNGVTTEPGPLAAWPVYPKGRSPILVIGPAERRPVRPTPRSR